MNGKQKRTYSEHEVGRDMIAVVVLEVLAKYKHDTKQGITRRFIVDAGMKAVTLLITH